MTRCRSAVGPSNTPYPMNPDRKTGMSDRLPRSSGILLHPTSLPGPYGIGDLGPGRPRLGRRPRRGGADVVADPAARPDRVRRLALPVASPPFAGNPYLISPELLVRDGLLRPRRPRRCTRSRPTASITAGRSVQGAAARAGRGSTSGGGRGRPSAGRRSRQFRRRGRGLARRLRPVHGAQGRPRGAESWHDWPAGLRTPRAGGPGRGPRRAGRRGRRATGSASSCSPASGTALRDYARDARHQADRRRADLRLRRLGRRVGQPATCSCSTPDRRPTVVAGVPPDYFSPTGQLWGNPHYDWDAMKRDRLRLVGGPAAGDARAGGPGAARPLPRLRGLLGGPGRASRRPRTGAWVPGPGAELLDAAADRRWAGCRSSPRTWA